MNRGTFQDPYTTINAGCRRAVRFRVGWMVHRTLWRRFNLWVWVHGEMPGRSPWTWIR